MMTDLHATRQRAARAWIQQALKKDRAWNTLFYAYDLGRDGMEFLEWDELNPKKPIKTRLEEAMAAYQARLGQTPNLILVSEHDAGATFPGCEVKTDRRVRRDCYQVGRVE